MKTYGVIMEPISSCPLRQTYPRIYKAEIKNLRALHKKYIKKLIPNTKERTIAINTGFAPAALVENKSAQKFLLAIEKRLADIGVFCPQIKAMFDKNIR